MNKPKQNGFLSGTNAALWFNGEILATLNKYEAKVTGNFTDVDCIGAYATYTQYHGYKIEGTLSVHKVDSKIAAMYAAAYKSGVMPDVVLTSKIYDPITGAAERVAISDVVITEFVAAIAEAKSTIDVEFPFTATEYEYLEEI